MAAGFSIKNEMIQKFTEKLNSFSEPLLTKELLAKKLILDMEIDDCLSKEGISVIEKIAKKNGEEKFEFQGKSRAVAGVN